MPIETEIKLQLLADPGDRAMRSAIRRAVGQPMPRATTSQFLSIYFDTPEQELSKRRIALRLRKMGPRWLQTMKYPAGRQSGLQTYHELQMEVPAGKLDISLLPSTVRQVVWLTKRTARLQPTFETEITRSAWIVGADGQQIELAWDRGEIHVGKRSEPVNELELELKSGDRGHLFTLAEELVKNLPVRLGSATKAERGMRLARREVPVAIKVTPLHLSARDTVATAFRKSVEDCLGQMRVNELAILATGQSEAIHQFRVALRRLRAMIGACRDLIDSDEIEHWSTDLRWAHQTFGRARDLDVFVTETLTRLTALCPADMALKRFNAVAEAECGKSREIALLAISDRRYAILLLRLIRVFDGGAWGRKSAAATLASPARSYARILLQRRYKRVRKLGDRWPDLEITDLHRLRLTVKKMRYIAVAFSTLFPAKPAYAFLANLEMLQDCLGALNDSLVSQKYAAEIATAAGVPGTLAPSGIARLSGMIAGWHAHGTDQCLRHFEENWKAFRGQKRFWDT